MMLLPKGLLFILQNALFTSISLLIFHMFNYRSQNEFIHLFKKIKMLYKSQSTLWLPTEPNTYIYPTRDIHHYEFSEYYSNKNKEVQDILLRKQINLLKYV